MKNKIKYLVKSNKKFYKTLSVLKCIFDSEWIPQKYIGLKYPQTMQFPITNACNLKCIMCNIHNMPVINEMNIEIFRNVIKNPLFNNVKDIGINGGEPFLHPELLAFIEEIVKLPNLKNINMISNGCLTKLILEKSKEIYKICKERNISLHISFSLDGYGEVHDNIRGVEGTFEKVISTVDSIVKNQFLYCDSYDVSCTVVQQNVNYLVELDEFANLKKYPISYRIGSNISRLNNIKLAEKFNVFNNTGCKQTAKEFFFSKFYNANNIFEKIKYYLCFLQLEGEVYNRPMECVWQHSGVTLEPNGDMFFCTVNDVKIANVKVDNNIEKIFFSEKIKKVRKHMILDHCSKCTHHNYGKAKIRTLMFFIKKVWQDRIWVKQFK